MDLRSILNVDDRPKLATRSIPASRADTRPHHHRSVTDSISTRPAINSVKIGSHWSGQLTPLASPTNPSFTIEGDRMRGMHSTERPITPVGKDVRPSSGNKPRLITTNISSSSTTTKRRASAHSPVSRTSSSCSSPSPPTPMSMTSTSNIVHRATARQHKRGSTSGKVKTEASDNLSPFLQVAMQPARTVNMTPSTLQAANVSHMPHVHLNRVLPLPMAKSSSDRSTHRPCLLQQSIVPSKAMESAYQIQIIQASGQRLCSAAANCDYTTPKRRIVSQFFGRNKKETRLIPRHCWVFYCRQHYQRSRYRLCATRFAELQMSLVRATVSALEKEHIVLCWEIKLRKRALEKISKTERDLKGSKKTSACISTKGSSSTSPAGSASRERMLLSFCGAGKSFKHVYEVLDIVTQICRRDGGSALEFELLPSFSQEYQAREEERRRICRAQGDGSDSESDDDD